MKIVKKVLFYTFVFPILLYGFLDVLDYWSSVLRDMETDKIEVVLWEDLLPVYLCIPVRYVDRKMQGGEFRRMRTKNGKRYRFRQDPDDPNAFWVTETKLHFGCKLGVRFKVTDPEIEKQLIELFRTKPFEVLYREKKQQEEAGKTNTENSP